MSDISSQNGTTVIFPLPIDLLYAFVQKKE